MRLSAERDHGKELEQYPSKSKRLLKALLSRRKSKKDDMLYTYLDEYWYYKTYRKQGKQVNFACEFDRLHFVI